MSKSRAKGGVPTCSSHSFELMIIIRLVGQSFIAGWILWFRLRIWFCFNELYSPSHNDFQTDKNPLSFQICSISSFLLDDLVRTSFCIEVTSCCTIYRQVCYTCLLRLSIVLISAFSVTDTLLMLSVNAKPAPWISLSSKLQNSCMTSGATFTFLLSIELLLTPNLVSSRWTNLNRKDKSMGTGSPFANRGLEVSPGLVKPPGELYFIISLLI